MKVGGCILDKVGAIKNENGFASFANDLKVIFSEQTHGIC